MHLDHLAVWARDLELLRAFYVKYFDMQCGARYTNEAKGFTSYFLSFGESRARLELMHLGGLAAPGAEAVYGLAHFAIATGSREKVDSLTRRLRSDGYVVLSEPRVTGDGYYESVVADPEGNRIEITV